MQLVDFYVTQEFIALVRDIRSDHIFATAAFSLLYDEGKGLSYMSDRQYTNLLLDL